MVEDYTVFTPLIRVPQSSFERPLWLDAVSDIGRGCEGHLSPRSLLCNLRCEQVLKLQGVGATRTNPTGVYL
jgi:hypothetical protein